MQFNYRKPINTLQTIQPYEKKHGSPTFDRSTTAIPTTALNRNELALERKRKMEAILNKLSEASQS